MEYLVLGIGLAVTVAVWLVSQIKTTTKDLDNFTKFNGENVDDECL